MQTNDDSAELPGKFFRRSNLDVTKEYVRTREPDGTRLDEEWDERLGAVN